MKVAAGVRITKAMLQYGEIIVIGEAENAWISNGHWGVRRSRLDNAGTFVDPRVAEAVLGVRVRERPGKMPLPDPTTVLPLWEPTGWVQHFRSSMPFDRHSLAVYRRENAKGDKPEDFLGLSMLYVAALGLWGVYAADNESICLNTLGEPTVVVMPMRIESVHFDKLPLFESSGQ